MKRYFKVFVSVVLGALFLWLAFREVEFSELMENARNISYGWILPFVGLTLFAHLCRALRWRQLFNNEEKTPTRFTLYTGVMFGYLTNIVLPRVGEVARPVYVARQVDESNSRVIGTIVLERVIDVLCMLILMLFVGIFLISDPQVLSRLFGIDFTDTNTQLDLALTLLTYGVAAVFGLFIFYQLVKFSAKKSDAVSEVVDKGKRIGRTFLDGLLAIKELKNWPLFILYTALIWTCYILMTWVGFWMFEELGGLSLADALVLTMVSAVGISIPTPGGIGTYHLFITKTLSILYNIDYNAAFAYATIAHAATLIIIIVTTPVFLAIDKFVVLKREEPENNS